MLELIKVRAYEIYLASGCVDGRDLDNWLQAEREILDTETPIIWNDIGCYKQFTFYVTRTKITIMGGNPDFTFAESFSPSDWHLIELYQCDKFDCYSLVTPSGIRMEHFWSADSYEWPEYCKFYNEIKKVCDSYVDDDNSDTSEML